MDKHPHTGTLRENIPAQRTLPQPPGTLPNSPQRELPTPPQTSPQINPLRLAFQKLMKDQTNKWLEQQFQQLFLQENEKLIQSFQKAIVNFCQNPQSQECEISFKQYLSGIYLKIRADLREDAVGGDGFILASYLITEVIVKNTTALNMRWIRPLFSLQKAEINKDEYYLVEMMPLLLKHIQSQFPLTPEQDEAYDTLVKAATKHLKGPDMPLRWELFDYFENRLFYDNELTLILIKHLKCKDISVPQCLLDAVDLNKIKSFSVNEIEMAVDERLGKAVDLNKIKSFSVNEIEMAVDERLGKHGYILNRKHINSSVSFEHTSGYIVTTCDLLSIFESRKKRVESTQTSKCLFFIPGRIQIIVEQTDAGLQFRGFKASNKVWQHLITGNVASCNEAMLEAMVIQAKEEEPRDATKEWYKAQLAVIFSEKFLEQYQNAFNCDEFKKKFNEEAFTFFKEEESLIDMLSLGFKKLFSEEFEEVHKEEYKFLRCLYYAIIGKQGDLKSENIHIPLPLPKISLDYHTESLCILISHEAENFMTAFKTHKEAFKFIKSIDAEGNIGVVFNNRANLEAFLVSCNIPVSAASKITEDLYGALYREGQTHKIPPFMKETEEKPLTGSIHQKAPVQLKRELPSTPTSRLLQKTPQPTEQLITQRNLPKPPSPLLPGPAQQQKRNSPAALVSKERSHPGHPMKECDSQIRLFLKGVCKDINGLYKLEEKVNFFDIELDKCGVIRVKDNEGPLFVFNDPDVLKKFCAEKHITQVDPTKLYQELCIRYGIRYKTLESLWDTKTIDFSLDKPKLLS